MELVIGRSERAAVAVTRLAAYGEGFEFELHVLVDPDQQPPLRFSGPLRRQMPEGSAADTLMYGLLFADGSKVTNLGRYPAENAAGSSPVLNAGASGGSGHEFRQSFWVSPLPPAGPLTFACEWAELGIELTTVAIDGQLVIDAAARSQPMFADRGDGGVGWSSRPVRFGRQAADASGGAAPSAPK